MERTTKKRYTTPETVIAEAETGAFICTSIRLLQLTPVQVDRYVYEEAVDVEFK